MSTKIYVQLEGRVSPVTTGRRIWRHLPFSTLENLRSEEFSPRLDERVHEANSDMFYMLSSLDSGRLEGIPTFSHSNIDVSSIFTSITDTLGNAALSTRFRYQAVHEKAHTLRSLTLKQLVQWQYWEFWVNHPNWTLQWDPASSWSLLTELLCDYAFKISEEWKQTGLVDINMSAMIEDIRVVFWFTD